ncbi:Bor family protein [Fibrella sp. HMF5036]|uniref:Bor family protein n=2 Tax=Fibrella aquatilis TaxID=2817059 RepID=A0A939G424_9BACT|nr:Bor family protein [Fibrella aquatilis]
MTTLMSSCFTYTTVVGKGGQSGQSVSKWNNYVIGGLIPVGVSDPKMMANGATDYTVVTSHSFVNLLVQGITFGIYAPTTTTVTK